MPFEYGARGKNADGTENQDYCEHCYNDGKFLYPNATMEGVIEACIPHTVPHVFADAETAREKMLEFFPTMKRWKK
jgi:hypothetical protein